MCAALLGLMAVCSTMVFSAGPGTGGLRLRSRASMNGRPIEEHVQVAVRRRIDPATPGIALNDGRELLGDGARRLLEHARQLKRDGDRQIAERAVGRDLDGKGRHLGRPEVAADRRGDRVVKLPLQTEHHVRIASPSRGYPANFVIGLHFVIVKRLEASALRGRVHDGRRLMWIADRAISQW